MYTHPALAGTTYEEDLAQAAVATDEQWRFARQTINGQDSRSLLESLGVEITGTEELFYRVIVPEGWSRTTNGYHTEIRDEKSVKVLHQFCKLAPWEQNVWIAPEVPIAGSL